MSNTNTIFAAGRRYFLKMDEQKTYTIVDVNRTGSGLMVFMDDANKDPLVAYKRDGWGDQEEILARTVETFVERFQMIKEAGEEPHGIIDDTVPINWFRSRIGWTEESNNNDGELILSITGGRPEAYCAHAVAKSFSETVGALPEHVEPSPKKKNPLAWCPTLMAVCKKAGWVHLVGEYSANNLPPKSDDKNTVVVFMGDRLDSDKLDDVTRRSDVKHVGILESSEVVGGKLVLNTIEANTSGEGKDAGKQGVWRKKRPMASSWVVAFAIIPHAAVAKPVKKKPQPKTDGSV